MKEEAKEQQSSIEHQAEEIFKLISRNPATLTTDGLMGELNGSLCSEEDAAISISLSNTTNAMIKYF